MFEQKIKRIIRQLDDVIEIAKADATQQIFVNSLNRIFDKGEDKYNNKIGTYSTTKLPLSFFKNKAISIGKNAIIDSKTYPDGLSWGEFRRICGLQSSFVDLTFTTALNKSIISNEDTIYFKNEYGKNISKYNEVLFNKRIFAPSRTDKKIFFEFLNDEMIKLWK